jgi:hypothetical protein
VKIRLGCHVLLLGDAKLFPLSFLEHGRNCNQNLLRSTKAPLSVHQDFPAQHRNRRRSCNDYWNVTICLVLSAGSPDLWLFSVEILLISDHKKRHHTFSYILNPKFFPRNLMYLDQGGSVSAWRSLYPRDNLCSETEGELCWGCVGSFLISDRLCSNTV